MALLALEVLRSTTSSDGFRSALFLKKYSNWQGKRQENERRTEEGTIAGWEEVLWDKPWPFDAEGALVRPGTPSRKSSIAAWAARTVASSSSFPCRRRSPLTLFPAALGVQLQWQVETSYPKYERWYEQSPWSGRAGDGREEHKLSVRFRESLATDYKPAP